MDLFTLNPRGRRLSELVALLQLYGVERVVDLRAQTTPALERAAKAFDIRYYHRPGGKPLRVSRKHRTCLLTDHGIKGTMRILGPTRVVEGKA